MHNCENNIKTWNVATVLHRSVKHEQSQRGTTGPWMPSLLTDTHWRCTFDPINRISRPFWGLCSNIRFSFLYWNVSKVKVTHLFVIHVFHKTTDTISSLHLNCAKSLDGNWKGGIASEKWQLLVELIERQLAKQFDQMSTLWAQDDSHKRGAYGEH